MSISTPQARGRCTERNTFAYPQINDLQVLFLVSRMFRSVVDFPNAADAFPGLLYKYANPNAS